ncbi:MAG: polysaccharide lyase, partial [Gemmatimonadales bacterium]
GPSFFNPGNSYTWSRARSDFNGWRALFWASGLSVFDRRARIINGGAQGKVLRVTYPAGKFGSAESGVSFPWLLAGRYEELRLGYRVKFENGFLFTTSGKLPGVCGANDDLGCFRYTGGNKPRGDDGFSVRVVWLNAEGLMGSYVYHADQASEFGDVFVWQHSNGDPVHLTRDQWHVIVLRVRLNDPGVPNGQVEAWLDGEPVSLVTHLRFRDGSEAGRRIRINEVYFNTFHGGRHPSDAPAQTQHAFFDDLQLAAPVN